MMLLPLNVKATDNTRSVWVGEEFSLETKPNIGASPWNVKWTYPNELLYAIGGSSVTNRFKVTQYFVGTAYVKCEWEDVYNAGFPGLESSVRRSNSWNVTCKSNPVRIHEDNLNLTVGESVQLHYSHQHQNEYTSYAKPYFYAGETDVVSVSESGEVTAVGEGTAYVYLHSNISGVTPCCVVNVEKKNSNNPESDNIVNDNDNDNDNNENDEEIKNYEGNWSDFGAYNITWYNKTDKEFYISTPEELAGVAYLVSNGYTSFSGCKLHIINDIDLQGRNWTPIKGAFSGDIDGHGHIIRNAVIVNGRGFFFQITDAEICNIKIGSRINYLSDSYYPIATFTSYASRSTFKNIEIKSDINFDLGYYSFPEYSGQGILGGFSGYSGESKYYNIKSETNFTFKWGTLYSDYPVVNGSFNLTIGGIVGESRSDTIDKCQATNDADLEINCSKSKSTNLNVYYGGIVGKRDDDTFGRATNITSCLSKNTKFKCTHGVDYASNVRFYFGGIISEGWIRMQNCVAINTDYIILRNRGEDTFSYFGGITANGDPSIYDICYSNNNVIKNITNGVSDVQGIDGSASFSTAQMNSQAFVDEINFFNQLEFGTSPWGLDENGNLTLLSDEALTIENLQNDSEKTDAAIYNLQGIKMKDANNLPSGIYIREGKKFIVK